MDESTFRERLAVDSQNGGLGNLSSTSISSQSSHQDFFRCHRGRLEALLGKDQIIHRDKLLKDIKISAQSPSLSARFEDGSSLESPYIIGCDGPHSMTRQSFSNEMKLKVLPYVVFNGRRRLSSAEYTDKMHTYLQDSVLIQLQVDDVLLEISLNDYTASHVELSYTYSRPAREENDPLHKPNRAILGATDISDEFYDELDTLKNLQPPFAYMFDAEAVRDDRVLHWLMRSLMPNLAEAEQLAEQGVVLIGDAMHATPILGGEGANLAIKDGVELAEHIAAHGVNDLKRFLSARYKIWTTAVEESEQRIREMHTVDKSSV